MEDRSQNWKERSDREAVKRAEAYLNELPRFTKKNSLSHTRECLRRLGDPQKAFSVIHVAGTNGKGSTCAFLDSILRSAGVKSGLFTSPHLVRINERFQIGGEPVSDEDFLPAYEAVLSLGQELLLEGLPFPTYFETVFLIGMLIFARAGVSVCVLETGMGGRLDATSAVENPLLCVITSISKDHCRYLGESVEEIALEKAGIIRDHAPVVFDAGDERSTAVIERAARERGSAFYPVYPSDLALCSMHPSGIDFLMINGYDGLGVCQIPFAALYQMMNAALALKSSSLLSKELAISPEHMREGLLKARWPGRMEALLPDFYADGAHNPDGVRAFARSAALLAREHGGEVILLFSAVEDKAYPEMIREMAGKIPLSAVVTTRVGGERGLSARALGELFTKEGIGRVFPIEDPEEALKKTLSLKGEKNLAFAAGSLYLVGKIKEVLAKP